MKHENDETSEEDETGKDDETGEDDNDEIEGTDETCQDEIDNDMMKLMNLLRLQNLLILLKQLNLPILMRLMNPLKLSTYLTNSENLDNFRFQFTCTMKLMILSHLKITYTMTSLRSMSLLKYHSYIT